MRGFETHRRARDRMREFQPPRLQTKATPLRAAVKRVAVDREAIFRGMNSNLMRASCPRLCDDNRPACLFSDHFEFRLRFFAGNRSTLAHIAIADSFQR